MHTATITDREIDRLEELLASDIFHGDAMTLDFLQGFLCAIASGPEEIHYTRWIPIVVGESPRYPSKDQEKEVASLLLKFYHTIVTMLTSGDELELILYGLESDPEALDYGAWCEGYIYGTQIGKTNWIEAAGEFTPELTEKMEAFFLLSGMLKEDALKHNEPWLSPKEEDRALAMAEENLAETITDIHRFWQTRRAAPQAVQRDTPTPGRNDPCPCGSGKKFKDCCGKAPMIH